METFACRNSTLWSLTRQSNTQITRRLKLQIDHEQYSKIDFPLNINIVLSSHLLLQDAALNAEIRGRYIENWQRARTEQHQQSIIDKESGPSDSIEFYRLRLSQEQRIHAEVELLVNIFISVRTSESLAYT